MEGWGTSLVQAAINALEALEHMATLGKYSTTEIHGQTLSNILKKMSRGPGWRWTISVEQAGFDLMILLPLLPGELRS